MNILITGATGLIGADLIDTLKGSEHEIYTISRSIQSITNTSLNFSEDWDVNLLPKNIDAIIHLAQSENFRRFPECAKDVFYTNTLSTLKLADWAVTNGVKKFIYASSAGIYGNSDIGFSEENEIVYKNELGFYLGTKHCSEVILDNYSNFFDVIQLRFFFVYGKNQKKDMLIPRLVNFVKQGTPLTLQGQEGISINPIHVSDASRAIIKALELDGGEKLNIAGTEVLSIRQIGEIIGKLMGVKPLYLVQDVAVKNLIGDITKMKNLLLEPKVSFGDGVTEIVNSVK
jgi:UDP-glucose 4-epimerase